MKENLFEMLLSLVEATILRLKEECDINESDLKSSTASAALATPEPVRDEVFRLLVLKPSNRNSIRVLMPEEQLKLTKSSQQFMVRMMALGVLSSDLFEIVLHRIMMSDAHQVGLPETKWMIRSLLADKLTPPQLAYLDLVLYDKEDGIVLH